MSKDIQKEVLGIDEITSEQQSAQHVKGKGKKPKKVLTKAEKKKRTIKGFAIFGVVILCLAVIIGTLAIVNVAGVNALIEMSTNYDAVDYHGEQLTPEKDADGYWTFTCNEDLKVLQFTDIHIGAGFGSQKKDSWALNAVAAMIKAEKPDLVVVTGDIAYPVPFQAGTFNNLSATKIFSTLMENLGVYWTFTFGNHDTEAYSFYTREDICEYYQGAGFKYCLFSRGNTNIDGYGNNIIKVKNTSGIVTQAIVTIDSHSYTDGDAFGALWKYDNIHQNQIDWYAAEMDKIKASNKSIDENADYAESLAFFHIPLREYREAWKIVVDNEGQALVANANGIKTEVGQDESGNKVYGYYGIMGESDKVNSTDERTYGIYCGVKQDERAIATDFFNVGRTHGLKGTFCGHDHYNNFSIEYKGIRMTYGMSIDYLAYMGIAEEKAQRGCTIITLKADGTFDSEQSNYYQTKYKTKYFKQ